MPPFSKRRLLLLTLLAMIAFAVNSLLARLALTTTEIDPATFTLIRLGSGALMLWLLILRRKNVASGAGSWPAALALFVYAAGFSFAYLQLSTATGALILFGAVQITMIAYGFWGGERFSAMQTLGACLAVAGLLALLLPGVSTPPLFSALLMGLAGIGWGVYSLLGRGSANPLADTAANFSRALPLAFLLSGFYFLSIKMDTAGVVYAMASGSIASGAGYALWYKVLPALRATTAANVQLSVPVIAAALGAVFLDEAITLHLLLSSAAVLSGIALVISYQKRR